MTTGKHDQGHADVEVQGAADLVEDLEVEEGGDADEVRGGTQSQGADAPQAGIKLNHSERVLP